MFLTQQTKQTLLPTQQAIESSLLGLMLGDTIGLTYEGMRPKRIHKINKGKFQQSLLFGWGMVSDDTEHAIITARSFCKTHSPETFAKSLTWGLRWWFLRLPGGVGIATSRALIKSCLGFSYKNSGVFSAGNGPAMRAPILGVVLGHSPDLLIQYIKASTVITHTDPKAYIGALAIAQASFQSSQQNFSINHFKSSMQALLKDTPKQDTDEFWQLIHTIDTEIHLGTKGITNLLNKLGLHKGISGYMYHTLPLVLAFFFIYKSDFKQAISHIIRCGGDTDTTAAILGGVIGASLNKEKLPKNWLSKIFDYPFNPKKIEILSGYINGKIENNTIVHCKWLPGPLIFLRNLLFIVTILCHGFRRLLPPY